MSHWAGMRAWGPNPALASTAQFLFGMQKGVRNDHRAGGWTQSNFSGTELSWARLQGGLDAVAKVEPVTVVSAPLQLLSGRESCVAGALRLPCSSPF